MKCPNCHHDSTKVVDTRPVDQGLGIRRRRHCPACKVRFNTYESIEKTDYHVIKRSGRRVVYSRDKIRLGLQSATEKRDISPEQVERIIDWIEREVFNEKNTEVTSERIGELVLKRLKTLDPVAYVRYASVYHNFDNLHDFMKEIKRILK